jgi:hypothetical protein
LLMTQAAYGVTIWSHCWDLQGERRCTTVLSRPSTRPGWYSVGLAATSVVMLIFGYGVFEVLMVRVLGDYQQAQWEGVLITFYGITMLLCALGGGVVSLSALLRRHERLSLVWLAMLPGLPSCS